MVNIFYDDKKKKDNILEDIEDELIKSFTDTMESQFENDLFIDVFSHQLESDDDEIDTLQQRIKCWMLVVIRGGPIPNDVCDYTFDNFCMLYRIAIDLEKQNIVKALRVEEITP